MNKWLAAALLSVTVPLQAFGGPAQTNEVPPAQETNETAELPDQPGPAVNTGGLRETVTESLRTFVPSEAIDVDKPVDFPTNI